MRDRREQILKLCCLLLGALLTFQLARFVIAGDPSKGLVVPVLPSLPPELDAQAGKATNAANPKVSSEKSTNRPGSQASAKTGTNVEKSEITNATKAGQSNSIVTGDGKKTEITLSSTNNIGTNSLLAEATSNSQRGDVITATISNKLVKTNVGKSTLNSSNLVSGLASGVNATNATGVATNLKAGTNLAGSKGPGRTNSPLAGRMNMPGKPPELPAEIKERVDRITQGEILGQVMRPMPMALLGIAGQNAFLRAPEGQTGMIKEGEQLGSLKLLRIGTNRVLIEQEGEKKELSIFAGLGSESLMPKEPPTKEKKTNEPPTKTP